MRNIVTFNQLLRTGVNAYAYDACVALVAASARGNRRTRILNVEPQNIRQAGILDRLIYNLDTGRAMYIAGQDYRTEMAILRNLLDR